MTLRSTSLLASRRRPAVVFRFMLLALAVAIGSAAAARAEITFKKTVLDDKFRSEGCAVGDFNHDGKLDVSAGSVYYAAPDWHMVSVLEKPAETDPHGYSKSFCNFAEDINRRRPHRSDRGRISRAKRPIGSSNPKKKGDVWKPHVIAPITNNESPGWYDIDGDGARRIAVGLTIRAATSAMPSGTADPTALWDLKPVSEPNAPGH